MPKKLANMAARAVEALREPGRYVVGPSGLNLVIRPGGARHWAFIYAVPGASRVTGKGKAVPVRRE